jgi:hypothetical protein
MMECQDVALLIKSLMFSGMVVGCLFIAFSYGFKKGRDSQ